MDACFQPIPVAVGEVWYVPGGLPHAIGEGLTVLEVMEPTDLVVRCEFARQGIVVPPPARFMGRGLDFCLRIFDYTAFPPDEVRRRFRVAPEVVREDAAVRLERLIGPGQTSCFTIHRVTVRAAATLPGNGRCAIVVANGGAGSVAAGGTELPLRRSSRFFQPAATTAVTVTPVAGQPLELLVCQPGEA
jgi:mannose-6-phosphate isomerase